MDDTNRFDDFFRENVYLAFKQKLYNYRIRRQVVAEALRQAPGGKWLELGCGTAPTSPRPELTIYTDLSSEALQILRRTSPAGYFVVADCNALPFADDCLSRVIASEVLEHIEDDMKAISEAARVLEQGGEFVATYPRHSRYFTFDDKFVSHCRRYDAGQMEERLLRNGLDVVEVRTVSGMLDKMAMWTIVMVYAVFSAFLSPKSQKGTPRSAPRLPRCLVRLAVFSFDVVNRLYGLMVKWEARHATESCRIVELTRSVKSRPAQNPGVIDRVTRREQD